MGPPKITVTRRRLPHWRLEGALYFLTFRSAGQLLTPEEILIVREHVVSGDPRFYELFATVVLPDHVHILLRPSQRYSLSRVLQGIKGVSARLLNRHRGTSGSVWQDESFDRIVRDQKELEEKLLYMLKNPLKAGLTRDPWSYIGWYVRN